ncbi:MAG: restriction endonuclease subunit S [Methanospirillum hungatei]|nr:restriction endonuclease subunit S [Methanospirillum hungatei]
MEWLGEIPGEWDFCFLKYCLMANDGGVWGEEPHDDKGNIVLRSTEMKLNGDWKIEDPAVRILSNVEFNKSKIFEGDLILTKSSGSKLHLGKTAIATKEIELMNCCYSNFMQRLKVNSNLIPKYLFWFLNGESGREQLLNRGNTTTGLANLNSETIGQIIIAFPRLFEQTAIASFLDRETTRIDALIEKKQRQIELLQEKRAALISQMALRGGFNVSNSLASQEPVLLRLSKISIIIDCLHHTPEYIDNGVPIIRISDINNGDLDVSEAKTVDLATYQVFSKKYQPQKNDILISRVGSIGSISLVKENQIFCLGQNCAVIRPLINPLYLFHVLLSDFIKEQIQLVLVGSTLKTLSLEDIKGLRIPIWNQEILDDIIDAFLIKNKRIENLIIKISESIKYLQEYRSTLISAAVTGKIDVRNEATA